MLSQVYKYQNLLASLEEYQAQHPADSDTAIDTNWLTSIQWAAVGKRWYRNDEQTDANEPIISWDSVDKCLRVADLGDWKIENATRGDLRGLARVLGHELKEPANGEA